MAEQTGASASGRKTGALNRILNGIEVVGNKLPDPAILLVAFTATGGALLGAWGGATRGRRLRKRQAAATPERAAAAEPQRSSTASASR